MKKLFTALVGTLTLIGVILIGNTMAGQLGCEGQPINNNAAPTGPQQLFGDRLISQSFVAPRPNLNRLDIMFQTYGRPNTADVTLRLLEIPTAAAFSLDGPEIFRAAFNAAAVSDQSWRSFSFAPVANSAGKAYLIVLESPQSTDGNAITVGGIERNSYLPGTAFLGPIPVPADITFRSCYEMSVGEKLKVLAGQLTHHRPGWWSHPAFYVVIAVVYGVVLAGFLGLLFRTYAVHVISRSEATRNP
jgi:hypothetical protein